MTKQDRIEKLSNDISTMYGACVYTNAVGDSYVELVLNTNKNIAQAKTKIAEVGFTVIDEYESTGSNYTAYYIWFK